MKTTTLLIILSLLSISLALDCSIYNECYQCLKFEECTWAVNLSSPSDPGQCLSGLQKTCPPQLHYFVNNTCPCIGCAHIEIVIECSVGSESYWSGYTCTLNEMGQCVGTPPAPCCCMDDTDCDQTTSYCLYSLTGPTNSGVCTPYETEGESCGGLVPKAYGKKCRPDLMCFYPMGICI